MCGITGYFSFKNLCDYSSELNKSVALLKHRGPDDNGIELAELGGVGHTRLSIIDLSSNASQPMLSNDGNFILSFNGEIYNYIRLRETLEGRGAKFKTDSDTEVILRGYELMGEGIFDLLHGMYAIAIFNKRHHQLTLARDRLGIKPLYYYIGENEVFFASEMGALLEYPLPRKVNKSALAKYFKFNYIPDEDSMIEGVKQLQPGYYLFADESGADENSYHHIGRPINDEIIYDEAIEQIRSYVDMAVEERLQADVPVASFLSGGLDSSIISMVAAKHNPEIKTYSAGFSENPYFDETNYSNLMASKINTDHHVFNLSENKIVDSVEDILLGFSEPFADTSAIAYNLLAKKTSEEVKVVLSGDGADELFGGYRKHKAEWIVQNNKFLNIFYNLIGKHLDVKPGSRNSFTGNKRRQIAKWLNGVKLTKAERYIAWASIQTEAEVAELLNFDTSKYSKKVYQVNDINDVLLQDMKMVLPYDMLTKADRMGMQHGLEIRTPFLDHFMVNYVTSLPSNWKLQNGVRKSLLIEAYRSEIPEEIINRTKKGFEVPMWAWLNGPLKELMLDLLSEKQLRKSGLFRKATVKSLIDQTLSNKPGDSANTIWALMVFQVWFNKYKPEV